MIETFNRIIIIISPIIFIMGIGYLLTLVKILDDNTADKLSKVTFYISLPALLFLSIANSNFITDVKWSEIWILNGVISVIFILAWIYTVIMKYPADKKGVFIQGTFRSNTAYIGIPLCVSALGGTGMLVKVSLFVVFLMISFNVLSVFALTVFAKNKIHSSDIKKIFLSICKNPLIIATVAGMIFSFFKIPLTSILSKTITPLADSAQPISLIAVGASIRFANLGHRLKNTAPAVFIKLILLPALTLLIAKLFNFPFAESLISVLLLGTPTAVASYVVAIEMDGNKEFAADLIIVTTVFSVFTLSFWLFVVL